MSPKKRSAKSKNPFFADHSKSLRNFLLKAGFALMSVGIFIFVIYKAYKYALDPVNLENIPLVENTNKTVKKKFNRNDGLMFSNQDKVIYNDIATGNKPKKNEKKGSKKISQDLLHQQIFDIVEDIKNPKNASHRQIKPKSKGTNIKNSKEKMQKKDIQKYNTKSIFQILNNQQ